jgi:L-ribulokinase
MTRPRYALGLDYGTNSVRALVVNVADGRELAAAAWNYAHGTQGVILSADPNLARQHPADYVTGTEQAIKQALAAAKKALPGFAPEQIIGIGVDTTGSTPLPVDRAGRPLALSRRFDGNLAAMAWLWKDHTSVAEAEEITALAKRRRPRYLAKCGGVYSSEWFFSKILHCLRTSPEVFEAACGWAECSDWIPAMLTGTEAPGQFQAGVCAAGHKAMFNELWGGYPDAAFLSKLDPKLGRLRSRLPGKASPVGQAAGGLTVEWARRTGLPAGLPVSVGALDAHLGAIGSGIASGTLVKIIGTSTCDMMVAPMTEDLADIPGLCGIAPNSILPGYYGLEAGQSAVGDIFNWFVNYIQPGGPAGTHQSLSAEAARLAPGQSGLLALDWNNGNRTVLADQRLSGLLLGQSLYTTPAEIYRALIEATAFGALTIINRFNEYGLKVRQIVTCGGIAEKNPLVMQIYADVTGRPIHIARSAQACALGAAIAGAVAAGPSAGGYEDFPQAQKAMSGLQPGTFVPDPAATATYRPLYLLYRRLHDAFGLEQAQGSLYAVMKTLLEIRTQTRSRNIDKK